MEKLRFKKAQNQEWRSKFALPGAAGLQQDGCEFQANRSYTRGALAFQNRSGGEGEKQQEEEKEEKERRRKRVRRTEQQLVEKIKQLTFLCS